MRRQSKWVLFGKIFAIIGVLALILWVCLSEREEQTKEPLPQIQEEQVKAEPTNATEEVPEQSQPSVGEDGTVVLPFVPVE